MAGLVIEGDPGGWADTGHSLLALSARLETAVSDVTMFGTQPLSGAWYGPAAVAFAAHWSSRRPHYEELSALARRAGQALLDYARAMEDMRARAANLESVWCGAGLHLAYTGERFVLPPGMATLPPATQVSLQQALSQSATDVERLAADGAAATTDLAVALGPIIALLEEFAIAGLWTLLTSYAGELRNPLKLGKEVLEVAHVAADYAADDSRLFASQMSYYLREGTPDEQSAAGGLLPQAGEDAARYAGYAEWLGRAGTAVSIAGVALVGWHVWQTARRQGWAVSLERHSGEIASTAFSATAGSLVVEGAGAVLLAAGAPEIVAGVGAVAVAGIVAVGVGATVQAVVDHRKAIGHFVESLL